MDDHADLVRHIFGHYLELGVTRLLEAEAKEQGIKVSVRMTAGGKLFGGGWFSHGLFHVMLRRITYDGQIAHGDKPSRRGRMTLWEVPKQTG